jgi:hypothetical protein
MATVEASGLFTRGESHRWLHSRDWDLTFITLSVMLVTFPYLVYLGLVQFDVVVGPAAAALHTTVDDLSRNIVNGIVALLVGIPHTFSTFSRTRFDRDYVKTHRTMIQLSIIPPIVVIGLALFSLPLLLTIFFFWASIHTLHADPDRPLSDSGLPTGERQLHHRVERHQRGGGRDSRVGGDHDRPVAGLAGGRGVWAGAGGLDRQVDRRVATRRVQLA